MRLFDFLKNRYFMTIWKPHDIITQDKCEIVWLGKRGYVCLKYSIVPMSCATMSYGFQDGIRLCKIVFVE